MKTDENCLFALLTLLSVIMGFVVDFIDDVLPLNVIIMRQVQLGISQSKKMQWVHGVETLVPGQEFNYSKDCEGSLKCSFCAAFR